MNNASTGMGMCMMDCIGGLAMWGLGIVGLLVVILLVLGIAVLAKPLFEGRR